MTFGRQGSPCVNTRVSSEWSKAFKVDQKTGRRSTPSLIVKVALVDQSSTDVFVGALDPQLQRFIKGTSCDRVCVQVPERFCQSNHDGAWIVAAGVDAIEAGEARHQKVLPVVFNRKREQTRNWKSSVKPVASDRPRASTRCLGPPERT